MSFFVLKHRMLLFCLFFISSLTYLCGNPLTLTIGSEEGILINGNTGKVLFEKNAHAKAFPASITKIATALFILKVAGDRLDEIATAKHEAIASITPQAKKQSNYRCPAYWLETDGTHIGIKKGEEFPLKELLYAILIASANDAANVLAQHLGGTIPKFMDQMNFFLKELGCKNTHFCNPHGLHHPDHVTTPWDMALIAKEAMKYPFIQEAVSLTRYTCPRTNLELERTFVQTNLLLRKGTYRYSKAIGIKTGTTSLAGKTLVAAAREEERMLIAVVLGSHKVGERYEDVIKMFDSAFNEPKMRRCLLNAGPSKLTTKIKGSQKPLKTYLKEGVFYDFYPSEESAVKALVTWNASKLPIQKDECVGKISIVDENQIVVKEVSLFASESVAASFVYRVKAFIREGKHMRQMLFFVAVPLLMYFLSAGLRKIKKRTRRRTF